MRKITVATLISAIVGVTTAQLIAQKEQAVPAPGPAGAAKPAETAAPDAAVLKEGLVVHMDFDQPDTSGKVADLSGQKNEGKVTGAKWTANGHHGGAYEFVADGDRVEIKDHQSLNPPSLTVSAWIKTTVADGEWRRIIDKSFSQGYAMSIAGKWQGHDWSGKACLELGPGDHFSVTDVKVSDGKWHQVVATFDGTAQWLYVDGKPSGKPEAWKTPGDVGSTGFNVVIGCNMSNPPGSSDYHQSFRGLIDEPMIWNRALSPDEVAQLYGMQK